MLNEQKMQMLRDIRRIERELYLKKSQFSSAETMEDMDAEKSDRDPASWKVLIAEVGRLSAGGDSVDDVRRERRR